MGLKLDKTIKILLGAIALGLFLNASDVFIDKAYASDCATWEKVRGGLNQIIQNQSGSNNYLKAEIDHAQKNIIECIKFDATCLVHLKSLGAF